MSVIWGQGVLSSCIFHYRKDLGAGSLYVEQTGFAHSLQLSQPWTHAHPAKPWYMKRIFNEIDNLAVSVASTPTHWACHVSPVLLHHLDLLVKPVPSTSTECWLRTFSVWCSVLRYFSCTKDLRFFLILTVWLVSIRGRRVHFLATWKFTLKTALQGPWSDLVSLRSKAFRRQAWKWSQLTLTGKASP